MSDLPARTLDIKSANPAVPIHDPFSARMGEAHSDSSLVVMQLHTDAEPLQNNHARSIVSPESTHGYYFSVRQRQNARPFGLCVVNGSPRVKTSFGGPLVERRIGCLLEQVRGFHARVRKSIERDSEERRFRGTQNERPAIHT